VNPLNFDLADWAGGIVASSCLLLLAAFLLLARGQRRP
jgi:hypothetical protein